LSCCKRIVIATSVYFDASFLVSLYSPDVHSQTAIRTMRSVTDASWISTFAEFEFLNSLALRVFRKQDPPVEYQSAVAAFEQDMRNGVFQLKALPETVFIRARQLSRQTTLHMGTRASDLLHVAIALEMGAETIYTFDRQQAKLAQAMKLKTNANI
jgi:predicted nucleic acid-binding protein